MSVPKFHEFMLPLLALADDGDAHRLRECLDTLAENLGVSDEDKTELLTSGKRTKLYDRVSWAKTYLSQAGLIQSTGHGAFKITVRGREVLQNKPPEISLRYLGRFPEFKEFQSRHREDTETKEIKDKDETPQDTLEAAYQLVQEQLAIDLLERVKNSTPTFFETLVVDLLVAMGYGGSRRDAGRAIGRSGDEGIDGIIKEDRLGLDTVYVQAKRWTDGVVGRRDIQAFAGSLDGQRARKGVFITSSRFTPDARDFVGRIDKKIVLIDGEQLAQLMIEHGVGVTEIATYTTKRIDSDYFEEDL